MRRRVLLLVGLGGIACTSAEPAPAPKSAVAEEASPDAVVDAVVPAICEPGLTRSCYAGPEGTAGVGRCKAGVETCTGAAWSDCTDAVLPAADEDCGTPDDEDCDGRSDDCSELEVAFTPAFTSGRALHLADWGGAMAVMTEGRFWVVEKGGWVVDVLADVDEKEFWEIDELDTISLGGAWPSALLCSYLASSTRTGHTLGEQRWSGTSFSLVPNEDDDGMLQWTYAWARPWREGHAIALRSHEPSSDSMDQLDGMAIEYGSITGAEQRALQRKVDRLLARAKPRLEIIAAEDVLRSSPDFNVFDPRLELQDEDAAPEDDSAPDDDDDDAAPDEDAAPDDDDDTAPDEDAAGDPPKLRQPPALPGELRSYTSQPDGTVVILIEPAKLFSWTPGKRRWAELEAPPLSPEPRDVTLLTGAAGELLLRECNKEPATGTLQAHGRAGWSPVLLPTPACPQAIATASDRMRWMISAGQLWQRKPADAEPWVRVPLPEPWRARDVLLHDGLVWVAAETEGGGWVVLVDHAVASPRVLAGG